MQAFQIKPQFNTYRRGTPVRNEKYKKFVRGFACCVCGSTRRVEAAHQGPHGLSTKSDDMLCLPLCVECHTAGPRSLHKLGPLEFARVHGLDVPALTRKFNSLFESRNQ